MARRALLDDLLEIASRLSWQVCLLVAVLSALVLHLAAIAFAGPAHARSISDLGGVAAMGFLRTIASILQFVVPLAFLFGGFVGFARRSRSTNVFRSVLDGTADVVDTISWSDFESLMSEVFRQRGYEVTDKGGPVPDGGVDLELAKEGQRFLVQCKHWRQKHVGVSVVRELNGVVAARGAAGGYLVTSGTFTREAWHFSQTCSIELIDGEKISSLVREVAWKGKATRWNGNRGRHLSRAEGGTCPKCGADMVRRVAKQGDYAGKEFWGCSRYPACRTILQFGKA